MKRILMLAITAGFHLALGISCVVQAQNVVNVHWINDAGQDAATVLNTNGAFTTNFKGHHDLLVTRLTADPVSGLYMDRFGGASPGNNPAYLTAFVGVTNAGTGDGVAGDIEDLVMTHDATGALQFDFLSPLTPQDHILLVDVDGTEQYLVQAYVFNGSSYQPVNFAAWTASDFSGMTGIAPDATWPKWNPVTGILSSGTSPSTDLNEDLFVLTPDQDINRLVITKQSGLGSGTSITFVAPTPLNPTINLVKAVKPSFTNLTLTMQYQLQVSGDLNTWTNQGSAFTATNTSMVYPQYWDVDNWGKLFFRLQVAP